MVAYNNKDWDGVKAVITAGFVYDEVATQRKAVGANQVIEAWRGWANGLT